MDPGHHRRRIGGGADRVCHGQAPFHRGCRGIPRRAVAGARVACNRGVGPLVLAHRQAADRRSDRDHRRSCLAQAVPAPGGPHPGGLGRARVVARMSGSLVLVGRAAGVLFILATLILLGVVLLVIGAVLPGLPPLKCATPVHSGLPPVAVIGAIVCFWLGSRIHHPEPRTPPRGARNATLVFALLTLVLAIVALLLGYEIYALVSGVAPRPTITAYVRCAYDGDFGLPTTAAAWSISLILGHWLWKA